MKKESSVEDFTIGEDLSNFLIAQFIVHDLSETILLREKFITDDYSIYQLILEEFYKTALLEKFTFDDFSTKNAHRCWYL